MTVGRCRSTRLYRLLLRGVPSHLRHRHGDEMHELFARELDQSWRRGRAAVVSTWFAAVMDMASAWPRELHRRQRQRGRVGIPTEGRPIMLGSDIRYAVRSLARQKFATGLVVAMLALGIAANVAVFSLVNGLFFRPFPFDESDRLVLSLR